MNQLTLFFYLAALPAAFGGSILLPGGGLSVNGGGAGGASFTYTGTLTEADTLNFLVAGNPCLQPGNTFCTNGGGVLVTAGSTPVGGSASFSGTVGTVAGSNGTWTLGALLLSITGVGTRQLFPADASTGLGSATPPTTLTLDPTSLSALGFGSFSAVNPTLTFVVADTNYADNTSAFDLRQLSSTSTPEPSTMGMVALACGLAALRAVRLR